MHLFSELGFQSSGFGALCGQTLYHHLYSTSGSSPANNICNRKCNATSSNLRFSSMSQALTLGVFHTFGSGGALELMKPLPLHHRLSGANSNSDKHHISDLF